MLSEANATEMVVQRLDDCLMFSSGCGGTYLKSTTPIEVVALYAQALVRLLESKAGFRPSSERQVPHLSCKHLSAFFDPNTNETISELKNLPGDFNLYAIATSIITLLCYHSPGLCPKTPSGNMSRTVAQKLQRSYEELLDSASYRYSSDAINRSTLLTLLEATPHWIIPRMMYLDDGELNNLIVPLVQLLSSPLCSAPDFQYSIGLSLTVAAVLLHDYPGWEHPSNSIEDRATRAIEVYRYYKVEHHVEPKALVVFGLLGLLRDVPEMLVALNRKGEPIVNGETLSDTLVADLLTHISDFSSIADFRIHTLPDTHTITQHAKMTLLETWRAVVPDERSNFNKTVLMPCLMQSLLGVDALNDSNSARLALEVFLTSRDDTTRRICSELLRKSLRERWTNLKDLDFTQISKLIDMSLSGDVSRAPTAMVCLWRLVQRSIQSANTMLDEQLATVLADMLKHDAFESLRIKAPDLPVSPSNMFEVGFAEMWYPLLKEMMSDEHAVSLLGESEILRYMRNYSGAENAVPYLEELRDGRPWRDILDELDNMSSCDVEVQDNCKSDMGCMRML
ncbi:hypothetical protein FRC09_003568 [Ceratobasidium sp. 395]|nr:hypothetical protein FRC09_003568 [Ceratobasidium sp. 395]